MIRLCLALMLWAAPGLAQPVLETHLEVPASGLSGLVVLPEGAGFLAVSDTGDLLEIPMIRDDLGQLTGLGTPVIMPLMAPSADWPRDFYHFDAEGLAVLPDGQLAVAFEGLHRVSIHDQTGGFRIWVDVPDLFDPLTVNAGLEGLAVTGDGRLLAIPESWPPARGLRPIFLGEIDPDGDRWSIAGWLETGGGFDPVGLDIDAEGRIYLLERRFRVVGHFANRIRRITLGPQGIAADEVLWQSRNGQFGNLEGLALWRRDGQLMATLIGDDNFNRIQRRDLIELRLEEF